MLYVHNMYIIYTMLTRTYHTYTYIHTRTARTGTVMLLLFADNSVSENLQS